MSNDRGDGDARPLAHEVAGAGARRTADPHPASVELAERSATELSALLDRGEIRAVEIAEQLIARIEALDSRGPGVHSILELAPDALDVAARLDAERAAGRVRGPLHGVPVLVKDNIDTVAPLHTTAGSLVFGGCSPATDASLVSVLRAAGAVVLGKSNLSEWANFRGRPSSSGWSAVGGQTRNPHVLDHSPGGSSSGSAAAIAARLAPLAVGTETDGSLICPSAACGVVTVKPTVGLVSRTGILPISFSQDTAGPLARTVDDAALLLEVLALATDDGEDETARAALRPGSYTTRFSELLGNGDLSGLCIGAVRDEGLCGYHPATDAVFESTLEALRAAGAQVVDPVTGVPGDAQLADRELTVLTTEFRAAAHAYFARRAGGRTDCPRLPHTLDDVLAHAEAEPAERIDRFATDLIARAARTEGLETEVYAAAFEENRCAARGGLGTAFSTHAVDVLVAPAMAPAWPIDHVLGDHLLGGAWSASAVAGYPSATVPTGMVNGLPVGVALLGPAWSEGLLLRVMFAVERALGPARTMPRPAFEDRVPLLD